MKRWPDLIALLRKKAPVVETAEEKVALHLRVANLFLEKFSNQAEAIKAYETMLELDPDNSEALGVRQADVREAPRLGEADRGQPARDRQAARSDERKARRIEVAKLASEKMKKPSVSIDLWQKVLADDAENLEALGELEKLYEREKAWSELGAVLERQVAATSDATRKSALCVKLGILFTEKVQNAAQATAAWQALLALEPENRRAQDALKKLYLQQKDWNALEAFYASQNKWDELVRVLERQAESEDDSGRIGLWNKIGELYRDRLTKADRAQKAFEKTLSFDGQNLPAALALIPLYEKAKEVKRLADVLLIELGSHARRERTPARMQRLADLLDMGAGDKRGALTIALQALGETPSDEWAITTSRRLAAESGNWPELVEAYEAVLPRVRDEGAALALLSTLAAAYEGELANPEAAIARNQKILEIARQGPRRRRCARAAVHRDRSLPRSARGLRQEAALAKTKAEELEIRFKLASLYEEEIEQPDKAIELYTAILKQDPEQLAALAALDRLYQQLGRWKELSETIVKEIDLSTDMAAVAELKFRRGAVLEQYLATGRARWRRTARRWSSMRRTSARGPRCRRICRTGLDLQRAAVKVLEPIYEANNDIARLVEVQRIKLAHEKKTDKRVDLLLRIGQLEGQLGNTDQAWEAYTRAVAESPASSPAREALENLANILDNWQPLIALYEKALSVKGKERLAPDLERELLLVVAVAYDEKLAQSDRAVEYFRRAQSIQPEDASALVALERLYTRTERWSDLVDTLLKKAQLVTDDAEREEIRIRTARVWEEMLGNAEQAIVAWNVVLQDNPANVQALRALDRLYMQRGEHRELADNLQRQLNLVADEPAETVASAGAAGRVARAVPRSAGRRRRQLRQDPADRAGTQRDHRGARAHLPQRRSTSWTSRCCWSRSTRAAATGRS